MTDFYYIVSHRAQRQSHFITTTNSAGNISILRDTARQQSEFDAMIERVKQDAFRTSGVNPVFVNDVSYDGPGATKEDVVLKWCLFSHSPALAFAMLVEGTVSEHAWPEPMVGVGEEEMLVRFFEVVATQCW